MHIHVHACAHVAVPLPLLCSSRPAKALPTFNTDQKPFWRLDTKKTSSSPELLSFEGFSSSFPLRQPGVTLFPCTKGKVTFPNADGNPVTIMDRLMGRAGEQVSIPLPHFHTQPSSPSANPPCSLSSSHYPVQQEPRFLSPGLLHGQRTALPTKPPGRPITKLYTVHVLSHFNFKDTLA